MERVEIAITTKMPSELQDDYVSNHYEVDSNINVSTHNEERAKFFKINLEEVANLLNNKSLEEKDKTIVELMEQIQLLKEDNEVIRTVAFKEQCRADKAERKLKKVSNN